jgi:membrane-bound lytic murein transglycosylase MltF
MFFVPMTRASAETAQPLPGFSAWTGDLDGMEERRLIRILVPYSKTIYFIDKGEQLGTAVDLGQALEEWLNKGKKKEIERIRVAFVPVPRDRLLPALVEGLGDIAAGSLTITPDRLKVVDFATPFAKDVKEVLVTGPSAPPVSSLDDLAGGTLFVRESSSYHEHLVALNEQRKQSGKAEIVMRPIDESLEDEDLIEMVNAGLLPWCVMDDFSARIWSEVFDDVVVHDDIAIADDGELAWAIRKDSPLLDARLAEFVKGHKVGTTFGNMLRKRYYQSDKIVRGATSQAELDKFEALRALFEKHGATYGFDALFLTAQGYQESHLDQTERSPRGAVGIMQLLPSTAADKAIGIDGIAESADRNIEAGAKYMRHLTTTYVTDTELKPLDRMLLTLAAYNAGPGNLRKIRRATADMGLDQNIWFGNVENGAAKVIGRETVQYVSNIYKYYFAYGAYAEQLAAKPKTDEAAAQ